MASLFYFIRKDAFNIQEQREILQLGKRLN